MSNPQYTNKKPLGPENTVVVERPFWPNGPEFIEESEVKPGEVLPEACKSAVSAKLFFIGIGIILYSILMIYIGGRLS